MTDITMPRLSDSMEEGTILKWLKADGDEVAVGDELVEIETDKATATHDAEVAGVLAIVAAEGDSLPVGAVIARIGAAGEVGAASAAQVSAEASVESSAPVATARSAAPAAPASDDDDDGRGVRASPLARRVAAEHGVALSTLTGTGPRGRVTRRDVETHLGIESPAPQPVAAPRPPAPDTAAQTSAPAGGGGARQGLSRLQATIARRMVETQATVPDFQVATEVRMDAAIALRAELKALATGDDVVPSLNDVVVRAAAVALRDHPRANARFDGDAFVLHERVNVGVAVATDDALVVPTVFDADGKSLGQIARDTRRLAAAVRDGSVAPADLEGGTFTVSNLGMFGMTSISPVINGGQAAILGVGATREVLARRDGEIVDERLMTLTLNCDHRILYGADGSRLLARIRELLEAPLRLAL